MDIIQPSVSPKTINNAATLAAADNDLVTIPGIQVGYLKRLALNNVANPGKATITVKDYYTPDSSNGNPPPVAPVTKPRYSVVVPAGESVDIDGHTISKHMGLLRITSDTAGVIASYVLELQ